MDDHDLVQRAVRALQGAGVTQVPDYEATRLRVAVETHADVASAVARVSAFAPETGWVQHCSAVRLWDGTWRDADGPALAGEFVRGGESLHLNYGTSGWTLVQLIEGEGEAAIACTHQYESVAAVNGAQVPGHALRYRVYLMRSEGVGLRPAQSRFIGFGEA